MIEFALFLHGLYRRDQLSFFKRIARGRIKVAVDGGYRFFAKAGLHPDLLIGDLDSIDRIPARALKKIEVIQHPRHKNKTDSQLALEYVLTQKAKQVDIIMPDIGEPDHFLGNLMLLSSKKVIAHAKKLAILSYKHEILLMADSRCRFEGCRGDLLSVIPISASIRLDCTGLEYLASDLKISRGQSHSLRNSINSARATVAVRGQALVIRQFAKAGRRGRVVHT